jgi:hypothetical protein
MNRASSKYGEEAEVNTIFLFYPSFRLLSVNLTITITAAVTTTCDRI